MTDKRRKKRAVFKPLPIVSINSVTDSFDCQCQLIILDCYKSEHYNHSVTVFGLMLSTIEQSEKSALKAKLGKAKTKDLVIYLSLISQPSNPISELSLNLFEIKLYLMFKHFNESSAKSTIANAYRALSSKSQVKHRLSAINCDCRDYSDLDKHRLNIDDTLREITKTAQRLDRVKSFMASDTVLETILE